MDNKAKNKGYTRYAGLMGGTGKIALDFVPEIKVADDGETLLRYTFNGRDLHDLSGAFYRHLDDHVLREARCDHINIHCVNGHPVWLAKFFEKFVGFGLPVEVTPPPTSPALIAAIEAAARHTPYKWDKTVDADWDVEGP